MANLSERGREIEDECVVDRIEGDARRLEHEVTARFARGTAKSLKADPSDVAQWLLGLAPRGTPDPELDIETVTGAVFVIAADGTVTRANRRAFELTGYPPHEILGTRIGLHVSGSEPRNARLHLRDGSEVAVDLWVCAAANDTLVATARPVGQDAATMREQDVAELVHDLKGPLSTIALEAAALQQALDAAGIAHAKDGLARIGHNVEFLDRMIHDMLDVALLDAGHFTIHRQPVDLVGLVADVLDRSVPSRDRERVFFVPGASVLVAVDDTRIERVVANLVGNATKYAPRDSGIVVAIDRHARSVRVSVVDAGPGLSAEEALYVFDKYRRTKSATRHDGAGLGLYVSRKIIEAHGGHIGVESAGKGSLFYFELPVG